MTEPFDAAAARVRLDAADRWGSLESNATWVRWCRQHASNDMRDALDALDQSRAAAAADDSQTVNTYAAALQIENEGLWRQLAAAQAALTLEQAAHRVTRAALWMLFHSVNNVGDHTDDNKSDTCPLCNVLKTASTALAATEGEGANG